ncbi:hypothetical protein D2Q93_07240, partial [Alicyclobacillaceae bacterium I2511]
HPACPTAQAAAPVVRHLPARIPSPRPAWTVPRGGLALAQPRSGPVQALSVAEEWIYSSLQPNFKYKGLKLTEDVNRDLYKERSLIYFALMC